jgi:hypothetical protein
MAIWGVLLFIAGCVMADTARKYEVDEATYSSYSWTFCDFLKKDEGYLGGWPGSDARCDHLVGATVRLAIIMSN